MLIQPDTFLLTLFTFKKEVLVYQIDLKSVENYSVIGRLGDLFMRSEMLRRWLNDGIYVRIKGVLEPPFYQLLILTLYGPNSFFRRFSGHNLRLALFVYRLIGATLIGNFFGDPFLK